MGDTGGARDPILEIQVERAVVVADVGLDDAADERPVRGLMLHGDPPRPGGRSGNPACGGSRLVYLMIQ